MDKAVLSTHGLTKRFGALVASDNVSLDLHRGEIHAIIGPNGAGKSTLIQQICGFATPDAGHIEFLETDVTEKTVGARARLGLARTFQVSALAMNETAFRNVLLGSIAAHGSPWRFWQKATADTELVENAMMALRRVGLADDSETVTAELSHGQRRQLEVAVALSLAPKAFLMDEPMAGLGAEGSKSMTRLLADLKTEAPILLVEHDMDVVFALADRVSVLVYGKVIASGTVDDIRSDKAVQEAYLGTAA